MEIRRKFEMLIATNRRYVIRQSAQNEQIACADCHEPTLTARQAADFFGITQRRVFRIIEAEAVHYSETEAGAVIVCLKSLAEFLETNGRK